MANTVTRDKNPQLPVRNQLYFYNEFLFHGLLSDFNAKSPAGQRIKTTQARALRLEMDKHFPSQKGFGTAGSAEFKQTLFETMQSIPGWAEYETELTAEDSHIFKDLTIKFREYTGFSGKSELPKPEKAYLPLSPYMPMLANRESAIKSGSRLFFVDGDSIAVATENLPVARGENPEVGAVSMANMARVFADQNMITYQETGKGRMKELGSILTNDDLSGVSALRPFMSDKEYTEITREYGGKPWANAGRNVMSPKAIARVREVVMQLRQEGHDFKFQQDKNPGQVKLHFSSGIDVRILDPDHEAYAGGRVYDDGVSIYYQTPAPKGSGSYGYVEYTPQTAKECLDIIHYALGQPVERWDKPGVPVGAPEAEAGKNLNFHSSGNLRVRAGKTSTGVPVSIYHRAQRSAAYQTFKEAQDAEAYLRQSVESARSNLSQDIGLQGLITFAEGYNKLKAIGRESDADGLVPAFSYNPDVKAIQEKYWSVLTGQAETLFRPDKAVEQFESGDDNIRPETVQSMVYSGTPEEIVKAHLADMLDYVIGNYEPGQDGKRFDPVNVSKFMTSSYGMFRNNDDLVSAMRMVGLHGADLKGDNFYNDIINSRLIRFGEDSKPPMPMRSYVVRDSTGMVRKDPFIEEMFGVIKSAIRANACEVNDDDILIDDNGIVKYTARRVEYEAASRKGGSAKIVTGEIGQIFAPNEDGVVQTRDHMFVPGYTAYIEPNKPGETKPYEERMVLQDYKAVLKDAIRDNIRRDLMQTGEQVGTPTSVNNVVRHLYETRYGLDFYEKSAEGGMSPELRKAIIETNRSRIKLDPKLMDESGRIALYLNRTLRDHDDLDDYKMDAMTLSDGRNLAIMEEPGDGMFDPYFTGNGPSQGVRYLVRGAKVDETGHVIPSKDLTARCAMVEYLRDAGRTPDFDAVDRMNMTGNGLLHGLRETRPVGMAQVSFGLSTFEDGIVVSKQFANENMVEGTDGKMRPLMKGDKLECHGNKGVISFVIDPNMTEEQLAAEDAKDEKTGKFMRRAVSWMKANPGLQVVMSPYSAVSRFNAGMAREAMQSQPSDLIAPDGTVHPDCIGYIKMTVLQQTADSKTHFSDDGTQKRSYGAQVGWALAANDCTALLKDSFQDNYKAVANLREMMLTCGMDIDPTGRFQFGYHPQPGEQRRVFPMGELDYKTVPKTNGMTYQRLDKEAMKARFGEQLAMSGGFMEVPFELKFPGGVGTLQETEPSQRDPDSVRAWPGKTFLMPVMSSYLRSGQEFEDGDSVVHDYTNSYLKIYDSVLQWQDRLQKIDDIEHIPEQVADMKAELVDMEPDKQKAMQDEISKLTTTYANKDAEIAKLREQQASFEKSAQSEYTKIADDIIARRFQGKHNIFRSGIMANKQSRSATAVWSPDPRLSVDEVGMNKAMMETLGLHDGDYAIIHRDPVLRKTGLRNLKVVGMDDVAGVAVHPAGVPKGMDGDFDGDTVGVHVPRSRKAREEARAKLSIEANLLDDSGYDQKTGRYKLFIADGQDIAAGWAAKPELKDQYEALEIKVNDFENAYKTKRISTEEVARFRSEAIHEINGYLDQCAEAGFGRHIISYENPEKHIQSIEQFVDDGAKGSTGKVQTYARFFGVEYDADETGHLVPGTTKDANKSLASREEQTGILKAKNMQQQYTGVGGTYSIRAVKVLMNIKPNEATSLNYLATQGVLQSKHDPHLSDRFEQILAGPARDLWRGYKLKPVKITMDEVTPKLHVDAAGNRRTEMVTESRVVDTWERDMDESGKPIPATVDEFKSQFMAVYGSKAGLGLSVNPVMVDAIAQVCSKEYSDGVRRMMDLEDELSKMYTAPLQELAYGGTFETMKALACQQIEDPEYPGLFDVKGDVPKNYNACMADGSVMGPNLQLKRQIEAAIKAGKPVPETEYKPIVRQDVILGGQIKESTKTTKLGHTVKSVRTVEDIPVPVSGSEAGHDYSMCE